LGRVRALSAAGLLLGAHAEVAHDALGIGVEALVAVRLVKHSRAVFRRLDAHLRSIPEVLAIFHVSGVTDLQVHVAVRDIRHLRELIVEKISVRPEVGQCETAVIFDVFRKHELPCYVDPGIPAGATRTPRRRARVATG
jgi:DNA-binding Lrp family transcriptional regulator